MIDSAVLPLFYVPVAILVIYFLCTLQKTSKKGSGKNSTQNSRVTFSLKAFGYFFLAVVLISLFLYWVTFMSVGIA